MKLSVILLIAMNVSNYLKTCEKSKVTIGRCVLYLETYTATYQAYKFLYRSSVLFTLSVTVTMGT